MKDMGYVDTLIAVAEDNPSPRGVVPSSRGERKPIHVLQYELLAASPHRYTHADLLIEVHVRHKGIFDTDRLDAIRGELLAKPHPCLRACLLPKKYGWGLHYDHHGRIALVDVASDEYRHLTGPDGGVAVVRAMRSSRT